jgi:hypothetical protein
VNTRLKGSAPFSSLLWIFLPVLVKYPLLAKVGTNFADKRRLGGIVSSRNSLFLSDKRREREREMGVVLYCYETLGKVPSTGTAYKYYSPVLSCHDV